MASVFDVARYICQLVCPQEGGNITTWKLQKLVYYSQAWSLVWDDEPLFPQRIEAWANGPVVPMLYERHKGDFKIADVPAGDPSRLSEEQRETIEAVVKHYGHRSAQYLSALTHREKPWLEARGDLPSGERSNKEITTEAMSLYYGGISADQE